MNLFKPGFGILIPLVGLALPVQSQVTLKSKTQISLNESPNIIFILTDDQRWDALGYAGNKIIQTPEMDKLAKAGCYFSHAIASTPICSASRASIFTGLYERTHKYTFQTGSIRNEYMQYSYPELLKNEGYYTGFFGKFGVNFPEKEKLFDVVDDYDRNERYPDYRGYFYQILNGDTVHLTRYTGQQALDFIENTPGNKPFCLSLSFSAPHAHDDAPEQYFWQKETDALYQNMEIPGHDLSGEKYFNDLPLPVREGFNRLRWTWRFDTPEKYQHSVKGYYRMIKGIDLEIAKIRAKLKEKGLDKNTVIILMGDNGYFLGERQLAGKWLMYDNSIRVPLIVFDPRAKKHLNIDEMALNIDIPATILDLAGIEKPQSWHGKSLLPVVSGVQKSLKRDTVLIEHLWEFNNIPPSEGVRTAEWKYFRYVNDLSAEELYNLKDDPEEINNLARKPEYRSTLEALRTKCNEMTRKYADPLSGIPSGLMVEYIREPENVAINDDLPEYCWVVPAEAVFQKAYQILVASSKENIHRNMGDVWNSGQMRSRNSTNIEHSGKPLSPDSKYYWKVRIWDQDNRITEYSPVQEFITGTFSGTVSTGNAFQIEKITPKRMVKIADESYFFDFGKDAFGTLELDYSSPEADTLVVRLGEKLLENVIDRNPGGTIRYSEVKLPVVAGMKTYTLELVPDTRNTLPDKAVLLPDSFDVITPFRYCEIDNLRWTLNAENIRQKAYFNYFDESESTFTSSDTILNQIWDLCKYSMKATTFNGLYVDGDRERIPYEADAYINQLSHFAVDREYAMAKQTIECFMDKPTWPTEWLLHTAMLVYQDYMYTGDTELIKKYYPLLKKKSLIDLCREDGLISTDSEKHDGKLMMEIGFADTTQRMRDIVDWPAGTILSGDRSYDQKGERDDYDMVPVNTVVNSFFFVNMLILADFAHILNETDDQAIFNLKAAKVKKAINDKLFNKEKGIYMDGEGSTHAALHANMMPLAFGIVPEQHWQTVTDFVISRGMACSVYGAQYLLEGLYNVGAAGYALELMTATHDRSWWNMINVGSTITLEAWDMIYKPNADWNHAWGAAPGNIIQRCMWGITPKTTGFGIVQVKPQLGKLKNTSITVPTIKGSIKASYQSLSAFQQNYTIELPANMGGELILPDTGDAELTVNGKKVIPLFHSVRLEPGVNQIEMTVNTF